MKNYFYLTLFLVSAMLYSCAGKKAMSTTNLDSEIGQESNEVSNDQRIKAERIFMDAQREKLIGNIEEAGSLFEEALKTNPEIDAAYFELAQIELSRNNDFEAAKEYVKLALSYDNDNVYYNELFGELLAATNNYKEAAAVFNQLKRKFPENVDYYFDEAYFLTRNGDYNDALNVFNELEQKVGVQKSISVEKYKIYTKQNKQDEAVAELQKLIDANPDETEFQAMLAEFYLVNNQEEKAIELYESILETNPNSVGVITNLADYYKKKGDNENYLYYSKLAFSNENIPVDAKISVLFNYIQYFDQKKEEIEDAYQLADLLIAAHPKEAKVYAIAGDLRNLNNETDKALEYYEQSLALKQDIFSVWQQTFFILSDSRKYEDLKVKTTEAKNYFPNQAMVYFFDGLAKQNLNELDDAVKSYNRGVKMAGDNEVLKAQFYSNLGDVYNDLGEFEQSDENFEKSLEIDGNNVYVLNNFAYYLSLRNEKLDKAAEMSEKSNKLQPNSASFLDTYAWILYQKGEYKKALEWQEKAIAAAEPVSATLYEHYGDILYKLGNKKEAINYWKKAQEAGDATEKLKEKIRKNEL